MWGRAVILSSAAWLPQQQSTRGMANLKLISMRLKSVKNIQKITRSMKMVSAAKYARAERELKPARNYGKGATAFYEKAEVQPSVDQPDMLYIAMSSDRGLCGAIHSSICRHIRDTINADSSGRNVAIVCVGDKSRAQLSRMFPSKILFQVNDVGRKPATFGDAALIAAEIINSGYDYGQGAIVYNTFKSVVSYKTGVIPVYSQKAVETAEKLSIYDSLDADVIQSYMEYSLASMIYYTFKEGAVAEQSARMSAMDAATNNASDMIDNLTLTFNRTRQAVITGELIEIISGAAAL